MFFLSPRYGFSNMRYIASLISGVGIFMMGAGLSWYHGIMGLLHPQPIESLLWVSVLCWQLFVSGSNEITLMTNYIIRPHFRLTVSLQALWYLKEVGDRTKVRLQFVIVIVWRVWSQTVSFSSSNITRRHKRDQEKRPPEWTFFLWIWSVYVDLLCLVNTFILNTWECNNNQ